MWACSALRSGCPAIVCVRARREGAIQDTTTRGQRWTRQPDGSQGGAEAYDSRPMATTNEVRELLTTTSLPADLVDDLLCDASAAWLLGESATTLAADLA